jgi:hypothetical protein
MDKKVVGARNTASRVPCNALQALLSSKTVVATDVLALTFPPTSQAPAIVAAYSSDMPTRLLDPSIVDNSIHVVARFLWALTSYSCKLRANSDAKVQFENLVLNQNR